MQTIIFDSDGEIQHAKPQIQRSRRIRTAWTYGATERTERTGSAEASGRTAGRFATIHDVDSPRCSVLCSPPPHSPAHNSPSPRIGRRSLQLEEIVRARSV